jgi:hypothetical protein
VGNIAAISKITIIAGSLIAQREENDVARPLRRDGHPAAFDATNFI